MLKTELVNAIQSIPDDEPLFILRGAAVEAVGSDLVRMFARRWKSMGKDADVADEAFAVAAAMDTWRKAQAAAPKQPEPPATEVVDAPDQVDATTEATTGDQSEPDPTVEPESPA